MTLKKLNPIAVSLFVVASSISILSFLTIKRLNTTSIKNSSVDLNCLGNESIRGVEDMAISSEGVLFVASQDRQSQIYDSKWTKGKIYTSQLDEDGQKDPIVREVPGFPGELQPLSLSLFESDGNTSLFVLSYDHLGYLVAIFSWNGLALSLKGQHRGPELVAPNAIAARSHNSYYVLNSQGLHTPSGKLVEAIFSLKLSHVLYHDGQGFKKLSQRFHSGYDLAYDSKTGDLIVSDIEEKTISFLKPTEKKPHRTIKLTSHPNRVFIEREQNLLWIAAQPNLLEAKAYAANPRVLIASSEVLKVSLSSDDPSYNLSRKFEAETEYLNQGRDISACSSMIKYKEHLFLGTPFSKQLLDCHVDANNRQRIKNNRRT